MTLLLDPPRPVAPDIHDDATRREFIVGGLSAGLLAVAGCGSEDDASTASPSATAGNAAFPVNIEHKYGSTEIPAEPKRVVTIGLTDQDPVLALGVTPVGVTDWYGDFPSATWPWAQDELGEASPELLPSEEINFEKIAALGPDLILSLYSGMNDQEYDTLSKIAPTVAQSGEYPDYEMPWQVTTRTVGRALGREQQADELVTEVEQRFTTARREHPEFEGTTMVLSDWDPGVYYPLGPDDLRFTAMAMLGLEVPGEITEMVQDPSYAGNVSGEQLPLFDADVLIWFAGDAPDSPGLRAQLAANPLYEQLDVVKGDRVVYLENEEDGSQNLLRGALAWSTALSLSLALDELVPVLAAALDGDPTTEPTVAS